MRVEVNPLANIDWLGELGNALLVDIDEINIDC